MKLYHLSIDGNVITDKPMTLKEIINAFGPIQKLESQGFKLVAAGMREGN